MADTFTQALANARRQAQLSGRPLSQEETAGIAQGSANIADERSARLMALKTQEEQLSEEKRRNLENERLANERLAEERRQAMMQEKQQRYANTQQERANDLSLIATGASIGGTVGGVPGAIIGGLFGGVAAAVDNVSAYCTMIKYNFPELVGDDDMAALYSLKSWVCVHHPKWVQFYDIAAPIALQRMPIQLSWEDYLTELNKLYPRLVAGCVMHIQGGDMQGAFELYRDTVVPAILEYAPEFDEVVNMIKDTEGV